MATLAHLVTPDLLLSCRSKYELENACLPRITITRDMCWEGAVQVGRIAGPTLV